MDVLKNCWAWVEKAPVAMAVTALKSESTVLALKLKKSVRNARDALRTAGSWTGTAAAPGGEEDPEDQRAHETDRSHEGHDAEGAAGDGVVAAGTAWGRTARRAAGGYHRGRTWGIAGRCRGVVGRRADDPHAVVGVSPHCHSSGSSLPSWVPRRSRHARRLARRRAGRAPQARNSAGTTRPPSASTMPRWFAGTRYDVLVDGHRRARELDVGVLRDRRHQVARPPPA